MSHRKILSRLADIKELCNAAGIAAQVNLDFQEAKHYIEDAFRTIARLESKATGLEHHKARVQHLENQITILRGREADRLAIKVLPALIVDTSQPHPQDVKRAYAVADMIIKHREQRFKNNAR